MATGTAVSQSPLVDVIPPPRIVRKSPPLHHSLLDDDATEATTCSVETDTLLSPTSSSHSISSMTASSTRGRQHRNTSPAITYSPRTYLEKTWKPVKKDILQIVHDRCALPIFQSLHDAGVKAPVLKAVALLSKSNLPMDVREDCIDRLALFLADSSSGDSARLGCVRALMMLCSPIEAPWQLEEGCLKETLSFVTDRSQDWAFQKHSEMLLLMELRAICLRYMEMDEETYRIKVEDVVKGSHIIAEYIAGAAKWVERGLKWSVPVMEVGLETAGQSLKSVMTPTSLKCHQRITHCSRAAKKTTNRVRETARRTANSLCDVSTRGIHMAASKLEPVSQRLVPGQQYRDVIGAAGTVGMASIGAAAIVGEAVFETTKAVAQKTASVTADVVRYKYGPAAGQVIQDASDTTGNILRTMTHITMLQARVVVKSAAKRSIKTQVRQQYPLRDSLTPHDLFADTTRADAIRVVNKLQGIDTIRAVSLLDDDDTKKRLVHPQTVEV